MINLYTLDEEAIKQVEQYLIDNSVHYVKLDELELNFDSNYKQVIIDYINDNSLDIDINL